MNRSSTFPRRDVREIGRRSFSIDVSGDFFGIGVIFAFFQICGMYPSLMDALKIEVIGPLSIPEKSLRIQACISSGPGAFPAAMFMSAFQPAPY